MNLNTLTLRGLQLMDTQVCNFSIYPIVAPFELDTQVDTLSLSFEKSDCHAMPPNESQKVGKNHVLQMVLNVWLHKLVTISARLVQSSLFASNTIRNTILESVNPHRVLLLSEQKLSAYSLISLLIFTSSRHYLTFSIF